MDSTLVITLVMVGAVIWLSFLGVAALRSRRREGIPPNQAPGVTDDALETRRLERIQQGAVLLSAFLAVGLAVYYLTETDRQDSFVDQFHEESVERGAELVGPGEADCWSCHGPNGVGGVASYVEKRTGVSVSWSAPALDDIFMRYDRDIITYWVTYGRGNSPMPPWGTVGGGPMNEQQIFDIVNYLESIQVSQQESLRKTDTIVTGQLSLLENAGQALERAIIEHRQLIADIENAPRYADTMANLVELARQTREGSSRGIDRDGDSLSDASEVAISELTAAAAALFDIAEIEALTFDPQNPATDGRPDADVADHAISELQKVIPRAPILELRMQSIRTALQAEDEDDSDGDGLSDRAERVLTAELALARTALRPSTLTVVNLDPQRASSGGGVSDDQAAATAISGMEAASINLLVQTENAERLLVPAREGLEELLAADQHRNWEIDLQGVADVAFSGDLDSATRAVGVFTGYCSRCHTSGWSAGTPYASQPGSGGFGPAVWKGRPRVQFLTRDNLREFLLVGAVADQPYGVNGFGNGQMPAFGAVLSSDDLDLLVEYLWAADLNGKGT
ncbi:MAG: c-type cytochrome [bacterium]|nr:c-type cytochrome [Acidimicrobiia bacterium]MCY4650878.1 c-type cytochrome [bacterium]